MPRLVGRPAAVEAPQTDVRLVLRDGRGQDLVGDQGVEVAVHLAVARTIEAEPQVPPARRLHRRRGCPGGNGNGRTARGLQRGAAGKHPQHQDTPGEAADGPAEAYGARLAGNAGDLHGFSRPEGMPQYYLANLTDFLR